MPVVTKTAAPAKLGKRNKRAARRQRKAQLLREKEEREGHQSSGAEESVAPAGGSQSGSQPGEGAEMKETSARAPKLNPWTVTTIRQTPSKKVDKSVSYTLQTSNHSAKINRPFRSFISDRMDAGRVQEGQTGPEVC